MKLIGLWGPAGSGKSTAASILVSQWKYREFSFATPLKELCREMFAFSPEQLYGPSAKRNEPDTRWDEPWFWDFVESQATKLMPRIVALFDGCEHRVGRGQIAIMLTMTLNYLAALYDEGKFTPRAALEQIGTEFGRAIWDDVWVHAAIREITDVRARHPALAAMHSADVSGVDRAVFSDARFPNEAQLILDRGGEIWWIDSSQRLTTAVTTHSSEATYEQAAPYVTRVLDNNGTISELAERIREMVAP